MKKAGVQSDFVIRSEQGREYVEPFMINARLLLGFFLRQFDALRHLNKRLRII